MPICSRCLFMLIGLCTFPFFLFLATPIWFCYGILMQLPMLVDGLTQRFGKRTSTNPLRILTGSISGVGLAIMISSGIQLLIFTIDSITK